MTLQEFINKYKGKKVDWDKHYGGQCVDLFRQYVHEVLGLPQPRGVGGAADFWSNYDSDPVLKNNFDKIPNTPDFIPQAGDVALWNRRMGRGFGHVAICTGKGDLNWFESFDQNWSRISYCELVKHSYKNFYGVLRPKKGVSMDTYKGIDLNNKESVKVCIDTWKRVVDGEFVEKGEYESVVRELEECKKVRDENIGRVKELTKQVDELKKGLGDKEAKIKELEAELVRVKKAHEEEVKSQVDFGERAAKYEADLKDLRNRYTNFLSRLEGLLKISKSSDSLKDREETIELYIRKLKNIDNEFAELVTKHEELVKECEKLRAKAARRRRKLSNEPLSALLKAIFDKFRR